LLHTILSRAVARVVPSVRCKANSFKVHGLKKDFKNSLSKDYNVRANSETVMMLYYSAC